MFNKIYHYLLSVVSHPGAIWALALLSFLEAFISPLTPLVLLIPMAAAAPRSAWSYVLIATIAATIGSVAGYFIGHEFILLALPYIERLGYSSAYHTALRWFEHWGLWMVFISSLTPLPFKIFTIAAGVMELKFIPFLIVAFVSRWVHFALIPIGLKYFAIPIKKWFDQKFVK
jgi:membrane protein YqaA with SNARE-associated domain